ncbi:hypothetical protein BDV93DRAFT_507724 [Ceratobasidium sp. AG-I]|nr:hypothetical protein BDV93DRAFT_507724 [Ceratobasidium sp. AG-I]
MEFLPSYTPEVLPGYDLSRTPSCSVSGSSPSSTRPSTPAPPSSSSSSSSILSQARNHPNYHYISEKLELDLGMRRWGTRLPCYGRGGVVEGTVTAHSIKHVERIVVTLIGNITASLVMNQIPALAQSHTVLHKSHELWSHQSSSSCPHRAKQDMNFSFSFSLTSEKDEIPPSSSAQLHRANAHISYIVRVDMFRRGMRMHETVQTEILYLPRSTTHYFKPFLPSPQNEKRPTISPTEWHTSTLSLHHHHSHHHHHTIEVTSTPTSKVDLLLPHDLRYPSGHKVPFLLRATPGSVKEGEARVEVVRVSWVKTRTGVVREESVVGRGKVWPSEVVKGMWVRKGEVEVGEAGRDVTWEGDVVGVSYMIRVTLQSTTPHTTWTTSQPIELTSHEWISEASLAMPALKMPAAERTALHLINVSL